MNRKLMKVGFLTIGLVIFIGSIVIMGISTFQEHNSSTTPIRGNVTIVLQCQLPTERPTMQAPSVTCPSITNPAAAKSYAIEYYPQFDEAEFDVSSDGIFSAMIGDEFIDVYSSGTINYGVVMDFLYVDIDAFPVATARSYSLAHITQYGGIGQYTEDSQRTWTEADDDGNPTDQILRHTFIYHREYNNYKIYGADAIRVTVDPQGPTVVSCQRAEFPLGSPQTSQQVISAESAWSALQNVVCAYDDFPEEYINIISIELCYYVINYEDVISVIHPAWRFVSDDEMEFYVDAFTGDLMA